MVRGNVEVVLLAGAVVGLGMTIFSCVADAEPFDKPVQTKVVDLGRSSLLMRREDVKLTCFYYPQFMIKQLDDPGNKGALLIAIVATRPGHSPECIRGQSAGERAFKNWDGYFAGVKRDLVFLYDSDGTDGGLGFTAFNSETMAKVFRDSVSIDIHRKLDSLLDFVPASDGQITLKYLRVVSGPCSVPKDGSVCWSKFKQQTGLRDAPMPACSYHGEDVRAPSVIGYAVEVSLFPKPSIKALAGPVKCWAPD
jgi:hypothetical protein